MGVGKVRPQADRVPKALHGLGQLTLLGGDDPPAIERFGKGGSQPQGLVQAGGGRGEVAARLADGAEQIPHQRVAWLLLQLLAIGSLGAR